MTPLPNASTRWTPAAEPRPVKQRPQAAWRERNQLKVWAHSALRSALKRGLLAPQPCEACGVEPAEAHHDDHARAPDVRWLCQAHHARENTSDEHASQERAA